VSESPVPSRFIRLQYLSQRGSVIRRRQGTDLKGGGTEEVVEGVSRTMHEGTMEEVSTGVPET